MRTTRTSAKPAPSGFTLIELLIVVLVVGLTAGTAIVLFTSSSNEQELTLVTDRLVDDLNYARARATTHRQTVRVAFDTGRDRYVILDAQNTVLTHPVDKRPYLVEFADLAAGVDLVSAQFGASDTLHIASGGGARSAGAVLLRSSAGERTVSVSRPSAVVHVE